MLKSTLLASVDARAQLAGRVVSGGRVNAARAVDDITAASVVADPAPRAAVAATPAAPAPAPAPAVPSPSATPSPAPASPPPAPAGPAPRRGHRPAAPRRQGQRTERVRQTRARARPGAHQLHAVLRRAGDVHRRQGQAPRRLLARPRPPGRQPRHAAGPSAAR